MKKIVIALAALLLPGLSVAAGGGEDLQEVDVNVHNEAALQRGAKLYANYCLGCHSLSQQRWRSLAQDAGMTETQVEENLIPGDGAITDMMENAMPAEEAAEWFGTEPPDLSVVARSRDEDWLYTYLKGFYVDEDQPLGVNNTVFDRVGMPHVLAELEGLKKPVYETHTDEEGEEHRERVGFEYITEGSMTPAEYDRAARDLTTFLSYVGEPAQLVRYQLGVWVIGFLAVFGFIAYLLKREYWKDIH
ncbi:MAG: cytochrome c1 [Pseudomonadota bacterium]